MIRPIERYGNSGECAVCKLTKFVFEVVGFPVVPQIIPDNEPPPPRPKLCLDCVSKENEKERKFL